MEEGGQTLRRGISRRVPASQKMTLARKMVGVTEVHTQSKWAKFAKLITCCIPSGCLSLFKMKDKSIQQAWREKVALCLIFLVCSFVLIWLTLFLQPTLCPQNDNINVIPIDELFTRPDDFVIKGLASTKGDWKDLEIDSKDTDRTLFNKVDGTAVMETLFPKCAELKIGLKALEKPPTSNEKKRINIASVDSTESGTPLDKDMFLQGSSLYNRVTIGWDDVQENNFANDTDAKLFVLNGAVLDVREYMKTPEDPNDVLDHAIRLFAKPTKIGGPTQPDVAKDATRYFSDRKELRPVMNCMMAMYRVAFVDKFSIRCGISNMILGTGLITISLIIFIRFFMALIFAWILEPRLVGSGREYDPYTVLMVACYSEGKEGLKTTLESLANTKYPNDKKIIFIVADGLVVGDGAPLTTPECALSLLSILPQFANPAPKSYIAVAQGSKQHNQARIYAGHYVTEQGEKVATLLIVKCGTKDEEKSGKPGNRGKRDSQIMLMSFFSRVFFNERCTPFDFDLFRKIKKLTKVTADQFEIILMVDADTFVLPDSLDKLVNATMRDERIMGCCGETRISNKSESWVTSIQVFEYFISHHLGKAFESVFGGVTCLPGCFCMYRIKSPKIVNKKKVWVPILANKDVVDEYSTNQTNTLHEKNLLLLGEDRFLTTLMLKNNPTRKLVFVPSAKCRTEVPSTYKVLNSQRRRWINSTIHNLFELLTVNELCGVFCCSMRFVVFLDLIGTITLPTAICLTYYTVAMFIMDQMNPEKANGNLAQYVPMISLLVILISPAVLILLTTFKLMYIVWMVVYLIIGLPVWNFFLPIYAWAHFDDFTWGQTRQVANDTDGHKNEGSFNAKDIPMRRIADWYSKKRQTRQSEFKKQQSIQFPSDSDTLYNSSPTSDIPLHQQYKQQHQ